MVFTHTWLVIHLRKRTVLENFTCIGDIHHEQRCELICIHTWKPWTTNCLTSQMAYDLRHLLVNPFPVSVPRPWNVPDVAGRGTNDASNLRFVVPALPRARKPSRIQITNLMICRESQPLHTICREWQPHYYGTGVQVSIIITMFPTNQNFMEYRCITSLSEQIGGWQDHLDMTVQVGRAAAAFFHRTVTFGEAPKCHGTDMQRPGAPPP